MKKEFYWKTFYNNLGKRKFIELIIAIILTVIGMIFVINSFGWQLVWESFALSYLFDNLKDFKHAIEKTNAEYTVKVK